MLLKGTYPLFIFFPSPPSLTQTLVQKLHSLSTEGCTALGPALAVAVGLTSETPGSKILLCTDGMANQGVGKVESVDKRLANQFYTSVAGQARKNGVTVSVITMEGQDCRFVGRFL